MLYEKCKLSPPMRWDPIGFTIEGVHGAYVFGTHSYGFLNCILAVALTDMIHGLIEVTHFFGIVQ